MKRNMSALKLPKDDLVQAVYFAVEETGKGFGFVRCLVTACR